MQQDVCSMIMATTETETCAFHMDCFGQHPEPKHDSRHEELDAKTYADWGVDYLKEAVAVASLGFWGRKGFVAQQFKADCEENPSQTLNKSDISEVLRGLLQRQRRSSNCFWRVW